MAKRRASGDGMVRRREDGRWEGRIVIGHSSDGSSIFHYLSAGSQKELMRLLHRASEDYRDVDLCEQSKQPLSRWLDRWLDEFVLGTVRDSTLGGYRRYVENQIKPAPGHIAVGKISVEDVRRFYSALSEHGGVDGRGLSPSSVRKVHSVLRQAMRAAVHERLVAHDPTDGAVLPAKVESPKTILSSAQLERFLAEVDADPLWRDFFRVELTTGLRRGEICGLKWSDFNSRKGELMVARTVSSRRVASEPKTERSVRTITLPPSTAELLRKRKRDSCSEWIFPDLLHPEKPISPSSAYTKLKDLLEKAGLPPMRFHDLRHTFATHALASGVDVRTLAGILGHTRASFTLDTYTHATSDMHRRASEIVGGMMNEIMI